MMSQTKQACRCCSCTVVMTWVCLVIAAAAWVIYAMAAETAAITMPALITASIASTLFLIMLFSKMFD